MSKEVFCAVYLCDPPAILWDHLELDDRSDSGIDVIVTLHEETVLRVAKEND